MEAISHDPTQRSYQRLSEMTQYRHTITADWIRTKLGTLLDVRRDRDVGKFWSAGTSTSTELYVTFNHYSAKEYLRRDGKQLLRECDFLCDQGPSYYLAQSCLHYLAAEDLNEMFVALSWRTVPLVQKDRRLGKPYTETLDDCNKSKDGCAMLSDRFPFLNYSSRNWYKHIETRHQAELLMGKIKPLLNRKKLYLPSTDWGHWTNLYLLHYPLDRKSLTLRQPPSPEGHNPGLSSLISLIFTRQPDWSKYSEKQIIDALIPRSPTILTSSSQDQIHPHPMEPPVEVKVCKETLEAAAKD